MFVFVGETPRLRLVRRREGRPDQFRDDGGAALGGDALPGRRGAHVHRFRTTTTAGGLQGDALLRAGAAFGGPFTRAVGRAAAVVAPVFVLHTLHTRSGGEFGTVDAEDQRQSEHKRQGSKNKNAHLENTLIDSTLWAGTQEKFRTRTHAQGHPSALRVEGRAGQNALPACTPATTSN